MIAGRPLPRRADAPENTEDALVLARKDARFPLPVRSSRWYLSGESAERCDGSLAQRIPIWTGGGRMTKILLVGEVELFLEVPGFRQGTEEAR